MVTKISDFLNTTFSTLTLNDAINNSVVYPGTIVHTTTGTPGSGIGAGIQFQVETSVNNNEMGMSLETVTTDVTAGSEDFDFVVKLMQNGAAAGERLRLNSSGQLTSSAGMVATSFTTTGTVSTGSMTDAAYTRIVNPGGGAWSHGTPTVTGALAVTLPVAATRTMISITIKVYEYVTNKSFELHVGGYPYSVGNTWANNPFAYIVGNPSISRRFNVRLGYTAGSKMIIYIGETTDTWSYPQVFVTEVLCGYGGLSASYLSGWSIGTATTFENVTATISSSDIQVGYAVSTNTANSVVKRDGSGNFSAGAITGTAGVFSTSLGIGVASPTGMLDVQDNTGSLSATRDVTAEFHRADGTYAPRFQIRHSTAGSDLHHTYGTTASNLTFSIADTERMRLTQAGSVGIGTTSPLELLHLNNPSAAGDTPRIKFTNTNTGTGVSDGGFIGISNQNQIDVWNNEASLVRIGTSGTERMRVDASGNVSIGTNLVGAASVGRISLTVNGTNGSLLALATGDTLRGYVFTDTANMSATCMGGTMTVQTAVTQPVIFATNSTERMRVDATGNVGIGSAVSVVGSMFVRDLTVNAAIQTAGTLTVNALVSNVYGLFGQNVTVNSTNVSTSTTTGALIVGGGIGAAGNIYVGGNIVAASAGATVTQFWASANDTAAQPGYAWSGATNKGMFNAGSGALGFSTAGTERMRIDSVGNVVIGTTSASARLHAVVGSSGAGTLAQMLLGYLGDSINYFDASTQIFRNGSATEGMRLDVNGNVGIGTNSPTARLHIASPTGNYNGIRFSASGWPYFGRLGINGTSGSEQYWSTNYNMSTSTVDNSTYGTSYVNISTNGLFTVGTGSTNTAPAERMRIDSVGNVGIGTSTITAGYRLQVRGGFAATTKSFVIDHPTKPGMKLRYGSLEGGENGVYVRGRTKTNVIELPDHWTGLVDENSITVSLTAIGRKQELYVKEIKDNKVYIGGTRDIDCFYTVFGERKDVEKLVVEF